VVQDNFEILSEELFKLTPTYQNRDTFPAAVGGTPPIAVDAEVDRGQRPSDPILKRDRDRRRARQIQFVLQDEGLELVVDRGPGTQEVRQICPADDEDFLANRVRLSLRG